MEPSRDKRETAKSQQIAVTGEKLGECGDCAQHEGQRIGLIRSSIDSIELIVRKLGHLEEQTAAAKEANLVSGPCDFRGIESEPSTGMQTDVHMLVERPRHRFGFANNKAVHAEVAHEDACILLRPHEDLSSIYRVSESLDSRFSSYL